MKLHRIKALLLKYFYITINRVDRIFDIVYWPLLDLFIWGFTSAYITQLSDFNPLSMMLGGIILWIFVWRASQDIAIYILEDFWSQTLYHVYSTPIRISENIISIILFGFLRAVTTFFIMTLVAFLLHSFNFFSLPILFIAIAISLLSLFAWSIGLFISSMILHFGKRIQVLAWSTVWLIQPFSCVFYPLSALPSWAANIAKFLPTTHIFENLRSLLSHGTVNYNGLLYAFVIDVVLLFLTALLLKFSFEKARKTGLLAKAD